MDELISYMEPKKVFMHELISYIKPKKVFMYELIPYIEPKKVFMHELKSALIYPRSDLIRNKLIQSTF